MEPTPNPTRTRLPHLIALVGLPGSGKTEVQRLLETRHGAVLVDDAWPMRQFAIRHLGLAFDDVTTASGKSRSTEICGRVWGHRVLLGQIGRKLEELFGEDILPWIATRDLKPEESYVFASVRMGQPWFYRRLGGVVVEVVNPLVTAPAYAFDDYDAAAAQHRIENDALARGLNETAALADLAAKVEALVARIRVPA